MNLVTATANKRSSNALQAAGHAGPQLSLPLDTDSRNEDALHAAWRRSGLPIPYHLALRNRPLAICLSCLADAMRSKAGMKRRDADGDGERKAHRASAQKKR
jgi:hypothetical protein